MGTSLPTIQGLNTISLLLCKAEYIELEKMKVLCSCLVLLTVAIFVNGDDCYITDLMFTKASIKRYVLSGYDPSMDEASSVTECRRNCQNYDSRIGECSHWAAFKAYGRIGCKYYNGKMEYEYFKDKIDAIKGLFHTDVKFYVGTVYCEDDKRRIQGKATARWDPIFTCENEAGFSKNPSCTYEKTVGVTKGSSSTTTNGFSYAEELSLTLSLEVGDPFGIAKASMSNSMSITYGETFEFSSTETFEEATTETISGQFPVPPGKVGTICQKRGSIGQFTLNSPELKFVEGRSCS